MILRHHLNIEIDVNFVVFVGVGVVSDHDIVVSLAEVILFLETFAGLKDGDLRFTVIRIHDHDIDDDFLVLLVKC